MKVVRDIEGPPFLSRMATSRRSQTHLLWEYLNSTPAWRHKKLLARSQQPRHHRTGSSILGQMIGILLKLDCILIGMPSQNHPIKMFPHNHQEGNVCCTFKLLIFGMACHSATWRFRYLKAGASIATTLEPGPNGMV